MRGRIGLILVVLMPCCLAMAQEKPEASQTDATELQKVNEACQTILGSAAADETIKKKAQRWKECVKFRMWGDTKFAYVNMGKNADGSWWVCVRQFNGAKVVLPYDGLDAESQQVLKDIWQLKYWLPRDAAKPEIAKEQQDIRAAAKKAEEERAAKQARRKANLAAPLQPPDKDGFRVWTNVVGDTFFAKLDAFVFRDAMIFRKGDTFLLDGKDETQLDDWQKAYLALMVKTLQGEGNAAVTGRRASPTRQKSPHAIFLYKDGTTVEWPLLALRGCDTADTEKDSDFKTAFTAFLGCLKANPESLVAGRSVMVGAMPIVSDEERAKAKIERWDALNEESRRHREEVERLAAERRQAQQVEEQDKRLDKLEQQERENEQRLKKEASDRIEQQRRDAEKRNEEARRREQEERDAYYKRERERREREAQEQRKKFEQQIREDDMRRQREREERDRQEREKRRR